ncbi:hypothetical protein Golax_010278, partial [Gossypium laxum]|nr:hypothetical protein [Gossypium laxum]
MTTPTAMQSNRKQSSSSVTMTATGSVLVASGPGSGSISVTLFTLTKGGCDSKEDLSVLAMSKDRVKKLKSPKVSPGPTLSKSQIECIVVPTRELVRSRLDVKYKEVKAESEARIRDAMFFQIALMDGKLRNFLVEKKARFQQLNKGLHQGTSFVQDNDRECFEGCNFINNTSQIQSSFQKYQLQECGIPRLLRVPLRDHEFGPTCTMKNAGVGSDENGG